jgi:hypothetical protein
VTAQRLLDLAWEWLSKDIGSRPCMPATTRGLPR